LALVNSCIQLMANNAALLQAENASGGDHTWV
jgi:hypothetical protein